MSIAVEDSVELIDPSHCLNKSINHQGFNLNDSRLMFGQEPTERSFVLIRLPTVGLPFPHSNLVISFVTFPDFMLRTSLPTSSLSGIFSPTTTLYGSLSLSKVSCSSSKLAVQVNWTRTGVNNAVIRFDFLSYF